MNFPLFLNQKKILILDGAMGTELERMGVNVRLPLWSARPLLTRPESVSLVHEQYVRAGVDIVTTNTFRTNPYTLAKENMRSRSRILTLQAVHLARLAAGKDRIVAGSIAPVEDCFAPELFPGEVIARQDLREHIANIRAAGVDVLLIETMNSVTEAVIACEEARRAGLDFIVSFTLKASGVIFDGEHLSTAYRQLRPLNPLAFMLNCAPLHIIEESLPALLDIADIPVGCYPNLGVPTISRRGWRSYELLPPEEFAEHLASWIPRGVKILGGCCGARPDHIAALKRAVAVCS